MMKTKMGLLLIVAAGSLALSVAAYADDTSPVDPGHPRVTEVQERQQNQQNRIANGIKSGQLTPKEATNLEKRETHIQNQKAADMAAHNGHLTKGEQRQLNREENKTSKKIYNKKHNARTTGTPPAAAGK